MTEVSHPILQSVVSSACLVQTVVNEAASCSNGGGYVHTDVGSVRRALRERDTHVDVSLQVLRVVKGNTERLRSAVHVHLESLISVEEEVEVQGLKLQAIY